MNGDLKLAFVHKALEEYSRRVVEAMRRELVRRKIAVTGDLLKSLSYKVYQQSAEGNANIDFAEWGRFIDMGVGKGHPLGGLKATKEVLQAKAGKGGKIRKPKPIYGKIAYGNLNGLIGDIAYGFTEETVQQLKQELEGANSI